MVRIMGQEINPELLQSLTYLKESEGNLTEFVRRLKVFYKRAFGEELEGKIENYPNGIRYFKLFKTYSKVIRTKIRSKESKFTEDEVKVIERFFENLGWTYETVINAKPKNGKRVEIFLKIYNWCQPNRKYATCLFDKDETLVPIKRAIIQLVKESDVLTEEFGASYKLKLEIYLDCIATMAIPILVKKKWSIPIPFMSKGKKHFMMRMTPAQFGEDLWSKVLHEMIHIIDPHLRKFFRAIGEELLKEKVSTDEMVKRFRAEIREIKWEMPKGWEDIVYSSDPDSPMNDIHMTFRHGIRMEGLAYFVDILHNPNRCREKILQKKIQTDPQRFVVYNYGSQSTLGVLIVLQMFFLRILEETGLALEFNVDNIMYAAREYRKIGIGLYKDLKRHSVVSMYDEYRRLFEKNKALAKEKLKIKFIDEEKVISEGMRRIWS